MTIKTHTLRLDAHKDLSFVDHFILFYLHPETEEQKDTAG